MISFEWDRKKELSNQKKHGVSFEEAKSVFFDERAIQFFDDVHSSTKEERFLMLGLSFNLRILLVCHCMRGNNDIIRIISARKATRKERTFYPGGDS
ncbi:MAG: BrnT family toxin [Thermodesulfobacteriota bacterium]|nr:BrnT family toxin [Thermodesulfobacteriota bacterium]